jgi:magnesium-transporting ATPase (P-type)
LGDIVIATFQMFTEALARFVTLLKASRRIRLDRGKLQLRTAAATGWPAFCFDNGATKDDQMRIPQTPRRPRAKALAQPAPESFIFKSMLVVSVLFVATLVMAELEFYVSAPAHSLSEAEVALRLTAR